MQTLDGKVDLSGRPSHLVRPARYGSGGQGFESQCLRRDRLIFRFSKWEPALVGAMFADADVGCYRPISLARVWLGIRTDVKSPYLDGKIRKEGGLSA